MKSTIRVLTLGLAYVLATCCSSVAEPRLIPDNDFGTPRRAPQGTGRDFLFSVSETIRIILFGYHQDALPDLALRAL